MARRPKDGNVNIALQGTYKRVRRNLMRLRKRLNGLQFDALDVIEQFIKDKDTPAQWRFKAAKLILDLTIPKEVETGKVTEVRIISNVPTEEKVVKTEEQKALEAGILPLPERLKLDELKGNKQ